LHRLHQQVGSVGRQIEPFGLSANLTGVVSARKLNRRLHFGHFGVQYRKPRRGRPATSLLLLRPRGKAPVSQGLFFFRRSSRSSKRGDGGDGGERRRLLATIWLLPPRRRWCPRAGWLPDRGHTKQRHTPLPVPSLTAQPHLSAAASVLPLLAAAARRRWATTGPRRGGGDLRPSTRRTAAPETPDPRRRQPSVRPRRVQLRSTTRRWWRSLASIGAP
jgi:hypothetical protein